MKKHESSEESGSDEESSEAEDTKESLEADMKKEVQRFSTYVRAITKDLEDNEAKEIEAANKKGKTKIKPIWKDSTFKIDLVSGLLFSLLTPERLIKYYIVYVWPMKKFLTKRQPKFFLKNKHIYPGADEEDIAFFKALWTVDGAMTDVEKDTIWRFWDALIDITEAWKEITGWERTDEDDMWIVDIDYKKAEENMEKDEEEISEDEETLRKNREIMQGNFDKYKNNNNAKTKNGNRK